MFFSNKKLNKKEAVILKNKYYLGEKVYYKGNPRIILKIEFDLAGLSYVVAPVYYKFSAPKDYLTHLPERALERTRIKSVKEQLKFLKRNNKIEIEDLKERILKLEESNDE